MLGATRSVATAVNDHGQVVGDGSTPSGVHAFWGTAGTPGDLETLPGHDVSRALAINNRGEIIGVCSPSGGSRSGPCFAMIGMVPAAQATGIGSDVQRPLATAVVGGLASTVLLTFLAMSSLCFSFKKRR